MTKRQAMSALLCIDSEINTLTRFCEIDYKEVIADLTIVRNELHSVVAEMYKYDKKNAKLTTLPWDED